MAGPLPCAYAEPCEAKVKKLDQTRRMFRFLLRARRGVFGMYLTL